jgi:hypothetical protein
MQKPAANSSGTITHITHSYGVCKHKVNNKIELKALRAFPLKFSTRVLTNVRQKNNDGVILHVDGKLGVRFGYSSHRQVKI